MDTDALRALLFPAPQTMRVTSDKPPSVRRSKCAKCPFGGKALTEDERLKGESLKQRLAAEPHRVWGCHEASHRGAAQICAGFAAWKK